MINKIWTLLKADRHSINILNMDETKNKFKKISTNAFIAIVIGSLCYCMGICANFMAEPLHKEGYTYVMLAIMIFVSLILSIMNTIYKSQGMLFTSKDNDLLLSLPIEKRAILASRIIKLMLSQYIWTAIILLPSLVVYVYYEGITLSLIISSIVMLLAIPILPVIVGTILGYISTLISSRFKNKNTMQIIVSVITFGVTFYISFSLSDRLNELLNKPQDIYLTLKQIYYPLGLYIESIDTLNWLNLLVILAVNLIPLALFVLVFSFMYFNIISKLSENHSKARFEFKKAKSHSVFDTLVIKEAKKYFRSSIYLLNTIVGPTLLVVGAGYLAIKGIDISSLVGENTEALLRIRELMPLGLYIMAVMSISTSNISASAISIEGKSIQLLKSLPINISNVFLAKIVFHFMVVFIPALLSVLVAGVALSLNTIDIIILAIAVGLNVFMLAVIGLVINILLPKTDASDIAIVKQSASSICSIIIGMLYAALVIYVAYKIDFNNSVIVIGIVSGICALVSCLGWFFLETYGVEKFNEL